jgi:hypothetical protein
MLPLFLDITAVIGTRPTIMSVAAVQSAKAMAELTSRVNASTEKKLGENEKSFVQENMSPATRRVRRPVSRVR